MTRSQTYATLAITLAISGLIALFFLSGGPEEVESLTEGDEPAAATGTDASGGDASGQGESSSGAPATDDAASGG